MPVEMCFWKGVNISGSNLYCEETICVVIQGGAGRIQVRFSDSCI